MHSRTGKAASNGIPSHLNIIVSQMFPGTSTHKHYTLYSIHHTFMPFGQKNPNPDIKATSCESDRLP